MPSRFLAFAFDYDGTLTEQDRPSPEMLAALRRVRRSGRRLVLVTGRILVELREVFPEVDTEFDAIVAENGAVLSDADGVRDLAPPLEPHLAQALAHRDIPCRIGRVVLACDHAYAPAVLDELDRLGIDGQLVRNRAALMVVPSGVTKGTGLLEALAELRISHHSTLAVGDAENDLSLLETAEVGVAVANAVDGLRRNADLVLGLPDGAGVRELLDGPVVAGRRRIFADRWQIELGRTPQDRPVLLPASQVSLLVTGGSGTGKSYLTGHLVEQLVRLRYGVLVVDREGDHVGLASRQGVMVVGGEHPLPAPAVVVSMLGLRFGSVVLDLSLLAAAQQDAYVAELLPLVRAVQLDSGSPHWIVFDEAHTAPGRPGEVDAGGPVPGSGQLLATYQPDVLPAEVRDGLDAVVLLPGGGEGAEQAAAFVARHWTSGRSIDEELAALHPGQALLVPLTLDQPPVAFDVGPRKSRHVRHWHKYTDAQLPWHLQFRFAGHDPDEAAGNIREFHHGLRRASADTLRSHASGQDLSRWLDQVLQEQQLAAYVARLEWELDNGRRTVEDTRTRLLHAIEAHYLG